MKSQLPHTASKHPQDGLVHPKLASDHPKSALDHPAPLNQAATALYPALATWLGTHRRDLPMRASSVSPWGSLVFEVMSQQTPIPRLQPIWLKWMQRWPTVTDVAQASPADILTMWDRLGYPSRALRLQQAAQTIVHNFGGHVPADLEQLQTLPGIGLYTASALCSFVFHQRVAVLDTNIRRVLTRILDSQEFPPATLGRAERARAAVLLPVSGTDSAEWNLALMELGALVCTQKAPTCADCPVSAQCAWLAAGKPAAVIRPRGQAWKGTDRQARGLIMAALRRAYTSGTGLSREQALASAVVAGGDPDQPARVLDSLLKDGLAQQTPTGLITLPLSHARSESE